MVSKDSKTSYTITLLSVLNFILFIVILRSSLKKPEKIEKSILPVLEQVFDEDRASISVKKNLGSESTIISTSAPLQDEVKASTSRNEVIVARNLPSQNPIRKPLAQPSHFEQNIEDDQTRNLLRKSRLSEKCPEFLKEHHQPFYTNSNAKLSKKLENLGKTPLSMIAPIKNGKIIGCAPPKAGFTSWRGILLAIEKGLDLQKASATEIWAALPGFRGYIKKAIKKNENNPAKQEKEIEKLYFDLFENENNVKFTQVRHPLARLLSAWGDKLNYWDKTNVQNDKNPGRLLGRHNREVQRNFNKYRVVLD